MKRTRRITLLAVADGVGGEAGGDVAARAAVDALAGATLGGSEDPAAALSSAVRIVNDAVLRAAGESGYATASSTLVAASVTGRQAAIANVGDSRAYLVRAGQAQQITTDHSGDLAHSITRFVGDPRGVAPDVFTETLRPRDRLVLCSDGLTLHVAADEIARVASAQTPARAAAALVELARSRGGEDNVTVVVFETPGRSGRWWIVAAGAAAIVAAALAYALTPAVAPATPSPSTSHSASPSLSPSPSASPSESASPAATPSASP